MARPIKLVIPATCGAARPSRRRGTGEVGQTLTANLAIIALVTVVCLAGGLGCGDGRPSRVPVAGRVLIDGQPLSCGHVRFIPQDARPSIGTVNAQGEFRLTCFDGQDGAVRGRHRVEVIGAEELSSTEMRWHAPKKYSNFETSGLVVEIDEPRDDLLIELS